MFVIIGYVVALGCIFGGYMLAGGNMVVILKALPLEMLIIGGGAAGAFVVCNPPKVLKATRAAVMGAFKGSKYTKARYMELLALQYDILQKARKTWKARSSRPSSRSTRPSLPTTMWWSSSPITCA
jgi:chemotaxis protein MotA